MVHKRYIYVVLQYEGDINMIGVWEEVRSVNKSKKFERMSLRCDIRHLSAGFFNQIVPQKRHFVGHIRISLWIEKLAPYLR